MDDESPLTYDWELLWRREAVPEDPSSSPEAERRVPRNPAEPAIGVQGPGLSRREGSDSSDPSVPTRDVPSRHDPSDPSHRSARDVPSRYDPSDPSHRSARDVPNSRDAEVEGRLQTTLMATWFEPREGPQETWFEPRQGPQETWLELRQELEDTCRSEGLPASQGNAQPSSDKEPQQATPPPSTGRTQLGSAPLLAQSAAPSEPSAEGESFIMPSSLASAPSPAQACSEPSTAHPCPAPLPCSDSSTARIGAREPTPHPKPASSSGKRTLPMRRSTSQASVSSSVRDTEELSEEEDEEEEDFGLGSLVQSRSIGGSWVEEEASLGSLAFKERQGLPQPEQRKRPEATTHDPGSHSPTPHGTDTEPCLVLNRPQEGSRMAGLLATEAHTGRGQDTAPTHSHPTHPYPSHPNPTHSHPIHPHPPDRDEWELVEAEAVDSFSSYVSAWEGLPRAPHLQSHPPVASPYEMHLHPGSPGLLANDPASPPLCHSGFGPWSEHSHGPHGFADRAGLTLSHRTSSAPAALTRSWSARSGPQHLGGMSDLAPRHLGTSEFAGTFLRVRGVSHLAPRHLGAQSSTGTGSGTGTGTGTGTEIGTGSGSHNSDRSSASCAQNSSAPDNRESRQRDSWGATAHSAVPGSCPPGSFRGQGQGQGRSWMRWVSCAALGGPVSSRAVALRVLPLWPSSPALVAVMGLLLVLATSWGCSHRFRGRDLRAKLAAKEKECCDLLSRVQGLEQLLLTLTSSHVNAARGVPIQIVYK